MAIVALTFLTGPLARADLYRCLMMDDLVDAPCCARAGGAAPSAPTIAEPCLVRIPGGVPSAQPAVRAPHDVRPGAAGPLFSTVAWPPFVHGAPLPSNAEGFVAARGSPPERLRVSTIVLRV